MGTGERRLINRRGFAPLFFSLLLTTGCLEFGRNLSTTTPSAEVVGRARSAMFVSPDVAIEPLGLHYVSGIDSSSWFKFRVETSSIKEVFDPAVVNTTGFKPGLAFRGGPHLPSWWDPSTVSLAGEADIELPSARYMSVGYADNNDGSLTVYIAWFET